MWRSLIANERLVWFPLLSWLSLFLVLRLPLILLFILRLGFGLGLFSVPRSRS